MPPTTAEISVVVPAHNAARFLAAALDSVLAQTRPAPEIVVVNDGSTDATVAVAARYHSVRLLTQENAGPAAARNAGIRATAGPRIAFLDADDMYEPWALERLGERLDRHPEEGMAYADVMEVDEAGHVRCPSKLAVARAEGHAQAGASGRLFEALLFANFIFPSATMIWRSSLETVGLFDETWRGVEDHELFLRIAARYPIGCVPAILTRRRRHANNLSSNFTDVIVRRDRDMLERKWHALPGGALRERLARYLGQLDFRLARYDLGQGRGGLARMELHRAATFGVRPRSARVLRLLTGLPGPVLRGLAGVRRAVRASRTGGRGDAATERASGLPDRRPVGHN